MVVDPIDKENSSTGTRLKIVFIMSMRTCASITRLHDSLGVVYSASKRKRAHSLRSRAKTPPSGLLEEGGVYMCMHSARELSKLVSVLCTRQYLYQPAKHGEK